VYFDTFSPRRYPAPLDQTPARDECLFSEFERYYRPRRRAEIYDANIVAHCTRDDP